VYPIIDYYLADKETIPSNPTINKTLLQNYVGDYEILPRIGYILTFSKENDTLFQQVKGDENKVRLSQISDNEFIFPNYPHSKFVFEKTNKQSSNFVKWHISDFAYKGQRIELKEFDKEKVDGNELVGMYYNPELNTTYSFLLKDNNLFATHSKNGEAIVTPFQPDFFVSIIGAIQIIRNNQNKVIGFYLSRLGIKSMKFEKINE